MEMFLVPVGLVTFGCVLLGAAWLSLGEYRKVFLADYRRAMTTEVFAALGDLGGPGYLAALLALAGILILAIGLGTVVLGLYLFFFR